MGTLFRRLRHLLTRSSADDLRQEMELHRAMRQAQLEASGLGREEAAAASRRGLGNVTLAREDAREAWIPRWIDSTWQDVRYAVRVWLRNPGVAIVAILTMTMGVGANVGLFTVFNAMAIRTWPVPESDRVMRLQTPQGGAGFSLTAWRYFSEHSKSFSGFTAVRAAGTNVLGEPSVPVSWVSGNYFDVLRVPVQRGRGFLSTEDLFDAPELVAVASDGFWRRELGADPGVIGRTYRIEDRDVRIVGVTSPTFTGTQPGRVDLWLPLAAAIVFRPNERWATEMMHEPPKTGLGGRFLVAGRLAPGVDPARAAAELTALGAQLRNGSTDQGRGVRVERTTFGAPQALQTVFIGAGLVLLLACASVGNLMLARAFARGREIGVRIAIGASRGRVVRQLLVESACIGVASAILSVMLATALSSRILTLMMPGATGVPVTPDATVLAFAVLIAVAATVLFGLAPALHGTRGAALALKSSERGLVGSRVSLRTILLGVQVAITVALLATSGLLIRAVQEATARDHHSTLKDLAILRVSGPTNSLDAATTAVFVADLTNRLNSGDAEARALASVPPMGSGNIKGAFKKAGEFEEQFNAVFEVSPSYFKVLGLTLRAGRTFNDSDALRAVVVNESLAKLLGGTAAAVGATVTSLPPWGGWNLPGDRTVVGVVDNFRATPEDGPLPTIYQPISGREIPTILFRDNAATEERLRAMVKQIDPRLRGDVTLFADTLAARLDGSRYSGNVAAGVGALALLLATVGMFSVFAFWVERRRREFGVRLALGARAFSIARLLLGTTLRTIVLGTTGGVLLAYSLSGMLARQLYGLSPLDPIAYMAVAAIVGSSATIAIVVPAWRAIAIDPVTALRSE